MNLLRYCSTRLVRRSHLYSGAESEVMVVQVSRGRSIAEPLRFLEKVKHVCFNKPTIYNDRAPLYD